MHEIKMRLAGKNVLASVKYESTVRYCDGYLADFDFPDVYVSLTDSDLLFERERATEQALRDGTSDEFTDAYLETLALYRQIADKMIDFGILLFHGSAVSMDGACYLFTAKSGTGKSTHTRLWREAFGERAVMINDDKPLIEISDSGVTVHGTPWCGKHRLGSNISAPLHAICILTRAEENVIFLADGMAEFPKILSQTYRNTDPEFVKKTLLLVDKLIRQTPIYRLGCNMEKDAPHVSYNRMKGKENEA